VIPRVCFETAAGERCAARTTLSRNASPAAQSSSSYSSGASARRIAGSGGWGTAGHSNRVSESGRSGRRFVHVRLDVDDIRKLGSVAPFAWSSYSFERKGEQYIYKQTVGRAAAHDVGNVGWNGEEVTAFRMHLPSKIDYHNTPTHEVGRGNILSWEQSLTDRLKGVPLELEARIETQSILYRTLWLFGLTFVAVALLFVAIVWWIVRRGRRSSAA